jgi:excisionase family DNA binding protein
MPIAKFEIKRKCKICGELFIAKTLESWYCSAKCSKVAYKRRKDEEERNRRLDEVVKSIPSDQEYIKVSEAYALFGISKDTLYRQIRKGDIPFVNLGKKQIRVSKAELMKLFPLRKKPLKKEKTLPKLYSLEPKDCYTIGDVCKKYHMHEGTLYQHIRKYSIPTRQIGNYVYVPKKEIDALYK